MSTSTKILLIIGAILTVGLVVFFLIRWESKLAQQQQVLDQTITQFKQLGDGLVRDQSKMVTKDDLEALAKQLDLGKIEADLSSLHATLDGLQIIVANTPGSNSTNLPSTNTKPNPTPAPSANDPFGFLANAQELLISEPMTDKTVIPFGSTTFSAWRQNPWDIEVYPRGYSITTVLGQDESGKHYAYNKFQITVKDKTYVVPIQQASFQEELPQSAFHFSPRVYLSGDIGAHFKGGVEIIPSIGLSLFNYGQTVVDPDWSFVTLGLGYAAENKSPAIILSPINYNIGHHIPYLTNLHIGPAIALDGTGAFTASLGLRVGM